VDVDTQQPTATRKPPAGAAEADVEDAEAALVEHYPHLARLAYLTLPPALGRHERVLAAHAAVQGALPRRRRAPGAGAGQVPGPRGTPDPAYALVRQEVLRGALAQGRRPGRRHVWRALLPPQVWGLRLHPGGPMAGFGGPGGFGGGEDARAAEAWLALDRALDRLEPPARAAFALYALEGLDVHQARRVLAGAGATDTRSAVAAAAAAAEAGAVLPPPGTGGDPCAVQARPTDLLRRRQHQRAALVAGGAVTATAVLLALLGGGGGTPAPAAASAGSPAGWTRAFLDPAHLGTVPASAWRHRSRLDFSAWPARGSRVHDTALLGRALAAWAGAGQDGSRVQVSETDGTSRGLPAQQPQLLYAGDVDQATVVLLYDGLRIVRYAEPRGGGGPAALDFARVDDAGDDTAAVVLVRTDGNARFLTAPWITAVRQRDLLAARPATQPLTRDTQGVTGPVRMPGADSTTGACGSSWPAIQLTTSPLLGGGRDFLMTDLGDLVPAHLVYRLPHGTAPLEATGPQALAAWRRTVCVLASMRGEGVREVNDWAFAVQPLPEAAGTAVWECAREETWSGTGERAVALFLPPAQQPPAGAAPGATTGTTAEPPAGVPVGRTGTGTATCGGFAPHALGAVLWKSPAAHWYLLAAGDPAFAHLTATGAVHATATGPLLTTPAPQGSHPRVTGTLPTGETLGSLS
jgi:hypothetical protein